MIKSKKLKKIEVRKMEDKILVEVQAPGNKYEKVENILSNLYIYVCVHICMFIKETGSIYINK